MPQPRHVDNRDTLDDMSEQPSTHEHDDRIRFQLKLPRDLHHRLKIAAAVRGQSMNDIIVQAAEDTLQPAPARQDAP